MAQHDRNLLKKSDIQSFMKWLDGNEWRVGKGEYQLMQVKLHKGWGAICIDAQGVITTPTEIAPLIKMFKAGKPRNAIPMAPAAAPATISEKQYLDDLRDDFAIAALQGILAAGGVTSLGMHESSNTPGGISGCAYQIADAMLAERKKNR
jgi:hypothetical protein